MSAAVRLAAFNLSEVRRMTDTDAMDLGSLGERKSAVFCTIPDNGDTSLNYMVGMLYTCALQELYHRADLLQRDFEAAKPNEKWVTDVTEFHLFGQKLYLSPILDLYNRELVSYSISPSPRFSQTMEMLESAFQKIPDNTNLILHSDQGWQYRLKSYQRRLKAKGIRQSMSRKGNCLDNAVMENFFGILKTELLYLQTFDSMEHFKQELLDYLDYYNHRRIKQ